MIDITKTDLAVIGVKQHGKSWWITHRLLPVYNSVGLNWVIIDTKNDRSERLEQFCDVSVNNAIAVWQGMNAGRNVHFSVPGTIAEKQSCIDVMFGKVMESAKYIFIIDETQAVKELFSNNNSNIYHVYTASGSRHINFVFAAQKLTGQLPPIIRENSTVYVLFQQPRILAEDYKRKIPNISRTARLKQFECLITNWEGEYSIMDKDGQVIDSGTDKED